jgi:hypothetical protein
VIIVAIGFLFLVAVFGLAFKIHRSPNFQNSFGREALRVALWIGVVRLVILWISVFLYRAADWRQSAGYILMVLSGGPELAIVASLRNSDYFFWAGMLSLCTVATSVILGVVWAFLKRRWCNRSVGAA